MKREFDEPFVLAAGERMGVSRGTVQRLVASRSFRPDVEEDEAARVAVDSGPAGRVESSLERSWTATDRATHKHVNSEPHFVIHGHVSVPP